MTTDILTVLDGGDAPMRALVLDTAPPRGGGPASVLQLRAIPRPMPPAPGWALVRPTLAGINARDLALLSADRNLPAVGAPRPLPMVPGCEVIGVVEEVNGTRWVREGQRVLIEPNAGCLIRGFPTCARCAAGEVELCENRDRASPIGPGADGGLESGGGWSEGVLAHEEMLIPADGISDQRGVLSVSLASAIHAVLRWNRRGDRVAVIGSGTTTRLVIAALRRLHPDVDITVLVDARGPQRAGRRRRKLPAHLAVDEGGVSRALEALGAGRVWRGGPAQLLERTAELVGARRLTLAGDGMPVLDRGLDAVIDCRGTAASVSLGLHLLRSGGTIVVAGRAGRLEVDWSAVWSRELTIAGSGGFGREPAGWRTYAAVREWLMDPSFPADSLVTHRFPLDAFGTAVATAAAGEAMGAVKVVFEAPSAALRERRLAADSELPADDTAAPMLLASAAARVRRDEEVDG